MREPAVAFGVNRHALMESLEIVLRQGLNDQGPGEGTEHSGQ